MKTELLSCIYVTVKITGRTSSAPNSAHRLNVDTVQGLRSGILTYTSSQQVISFLNAAQNTHAETPCSSKTHHARPSQPVTPNTNPTHPDRSTNEMTYQLLTSLVIHQINVETRVKAFIRVIEIVLIIFEVNFTVTVVCNTRETGDIYARDYYM